MARDYAVVIAEMIATIDEIRKLINRCSFEQYRNEWTLKRATERGLEIVSEASRHLPSELTNQHPHIPWRKIRALGNVLRHDYHDIADRVLWTICEDDLLTLRAALEDMARRISSGPQGS